MHIFAVKARTVAYYQTDVRTRLQRVHLWLQEERTVSTMRREARNECEVQSGDNGSTPQVYAHVHEAHGEAWER
jgi:hypothetical protein